MIAATYLIRDIHDLNFKRPVRLFEGFISFKDRSQASNHGNDVDLLRRVVRDHEKIAECILAPEQR